LQHPQLSRGGGTLAITFVNSRSDPGVDLSFDKTGGCFAQFHWWWKLPCLDELVYLAATGSRLSRCKKEKTARNAPGSLQPRLSLATSLHRGGADKMPGLAKISRR
jgi:hypothetical protein